MNMYKERWKQVRQPGKVHGVGNILIAFQRYAQFRKSTNFSAYYLEIITFKAEDVRCVLHPKK